MFTVFLIIQIMITIALVAVILLQRSEGGALGMGGGGGMGGLMTGRGAANLLTRTTAILAAGFFLCSIILTVLARTRDDGALQFDDSDLVAPVESSLPVDEEPTPVIPDEPLGDSTFDEEAAGADTTPVIDADAMSDEEAADTSTDAASDGEPVVPDSE